MSFHRRPIRVSLLLLLVACAPSVSPLHFRASFSGHILLVDPRGAEIEGRLAFDRQSSQMQFVWLRDAAAVSLMRTGEGAVLAFHEGVEQTPSPAEVAAFETVERIMRAYGGKVTATKTQGEVESYEVTTEGGRFRVQLGAIPFSHGR